MTRTQLTTEQLSSICDAVMACAPSNLLVFGLGYDSQFWSRLNRGGRTVFVEDNEVWFNQVLARLSVDARLVKYGTNRRQWRDLIEDAPSLQMEWPEDISGCAWDVILVDAPSGWKDNSPGRMKSIYAASQFTGLADETHVFVHDCDREIEQAYSDRYLGAAALVREIGTLRHYCIRKGKE